MKTLTKAKMEIWKSLLEIEDVSEAIERGSTRLEVLKCRLFADIPSLIPDDELFTVLNKYQYSLPPELVYNIRRIRGILNCGKLTALSTYMAMFGNLQISEDQLSELFGSKTELPALFDIIKIHDDAYEVYLHKSDIFITVPKEIKDILVTPVNRSNALFDLNYGVLKISGTEVWRNDAYRRL